MVRLELIKTTPRELVFRVIVEYPDLFTNLLKPKIRHLAPQATIYNTNSIIVKTSIEESQLEELKKAIEETEKEYKEKINEFVKQKCKVLNALGPFLV